MTINKKLEIDCKKIISDIYFSCENDTEFFLNLAVLSANIDLIQKTCFRNVADSDYNLVELKRPFEKFIYVKSADFQIMKNKNSAGN